VPDQIDLLAGAGPWPGEERFFEMFDILEAEAWAEAGGIAVHRNFDVTGMRIGGRVRQGPAYHVFGREDVLLAWGRRNGQRAVWLQDAHEDRWPPHFDVFGRPARTMERRLRIPPQEPSD
jgi:hypothetical protein